MDKQSHFEIDPFKETKKDKLQQLIIFLIFIGLTVFMLLIGARIVLRGIDILDNIKGQVKIIYLNNRDCYTYWERGQQVYPKLYPDEHYKVILPENYDLH